MKRYPKTSQDQDKYYKKKTKSSLEQTTVQSQNIGITQYIKNPTYVNLLKKIGIQSLFPIQRACFNIISKGLDLTAKDKTGSGKTYAYSLPLLQMLRKSNNQKNKLAKILIIVPTRQLAIQVSNSLNKIIFQDQFKIVTVYGGDSVSKQQYKLQQRVDIIVATPGRLKDFIQKKVVRFMDLKSVVLDQADQMLKQGFAKDIQTIFKSIMKDASDKPQTLLFSATIPTWVKQISQQYQTKNSPIVDMTKDNNICVPKTINNLKLEVDNSKDMVSNIKDMLQKYSSSKGKSIIFCQTKRQVDELYSNLSNKKCAKLHGDVRQADRQKVYKDFKQGTISIIVATNVAARGLDFPQVELVIQTSIPKDIESYIHRAGRTGRAGKTGTCIIFYSNNDHSKLKRIEKEGKFQFKSI